jgi:hypothetical protein
VSLNTHDVEVRQLSSDQRDFLVLVKLLEVVEQQ